MQRSAWVRDSNRLNSIVTDIKKNLKKFEKYRNGLYRKFIGESRITVTKNILTG